MNNLTRLLWIAGGFICVGLGVIGLLVPMMPGVVFLLIAAWCFSRSSERYHAWLLGHPRLGPPIVNWQNNRAISRNNKTVITAMLFSSIVATWLLGAPPIAIALQSTGIACVLLFIWSRPDQ